MSEMQTVIALLKDMSTRLQRVEAKVGTGGGAAAPPAAPAASGGGDNPVLAAYDAWLEAAMKPLDENAAKLKDAGFKSANKCKNFLRKGAEGVRKVVEAGTKCKEPTPEEFQAFMQKCVWDVTKKGKMVRTKKLGRNYEKQVAECMDVFSWPTQAGEIGPSKYLESSVGSVEYHSNRCRMEYKKTEHGAVHMAYNAAVKSFIETLKTFVVKNGMAAKFQWKYNGIDFKDFAPGSAPEAAAAPATNTTAPAPEPAPAAEEEAPVVDMNAMFAELNKGLSITKKMKHVSNDMKVYKNPKLRKGGAIKSGPKKPKAAAKKKKKAVKRPPPTSKYVRAQRMWYVENQIDGAKVEVEFEKSTQAGYLFKCDKAAVTFKGKGKNLSIVACNGTHVIFDTLISGVEITNCKNLTISFLGKCNMFQIDKTNGAKIWVSKESMDSVLFSTSLCSDLNVEFPDTTDETGENTITKPIPNAFEHHIEGGKVKSEVSHLYG